MGMEHCFVRFSDDRQRPGTRSSAALTLVLELTASNRPIIHTPGRYFSSRQTDNRLPILYGELRSFMRRGHLRMRVVLHVRRRPRSMIPPLTVAAGGGVGEYPKYFGASMFFVEPPVQMCRSPGSGGRSFMLFRQASMSSPLWYEGL